MNSRQRIIMGLASIAAPLLFACLASAHCECDAEDCGNPECECQCDWTLCTPGAPEAERCPGGIWGRCDGLDDEECTHCNGSASCHRVNCPTSKCGSGCAGGGTCAACSNPRPSEELQYCEGKLNCMCLQTANCDCELDEENVCNQLSSCTDNDCGPKGDGDCRCVCDDFCAGLGDEYQPCGGTDSCLCKPHIGGCPEAYCLDDPCLVHDLIGHLHCGNHDCCTMDECFSGEPVCGCGNCPSHGEGFPSCNCGAPTCQVASCGMTKCKEDSNPCGAASPCGCASRFCDCGFYCASGSCKGDTKPCLDQEHPTGVEDCECSGVSGCDTSCSPVCTSCSLNKPCAVEDMLGGGGDDQADNCCLTPSLGGPVACAGRSLCESYSNKAHEWYTWCGGDGSCNGTTWTRRHVHFYENVSACVDPVSQCASQCRWSTWPLLAGGLGTDGCAPAERGADYSPAQNTCKVELDSCACEP